MSGLSHTEEFLKFQLDNEDFFFRNKSVAAFFAPEGDDYSWQAFAYQLKKGNQVRVPAHEIKKAADYAVAAAKYRAERKAFGPYLSENDERYLKQRRISLEEQYPGYSATPSFNPSDIPNLIEDLKFAMKDPAVANTETAIALQDYFTLRDAVYADMEASGISSLKNKRVKQGRQDLIAKGFNLSAIYPDFRRLWERKLSAEVELINEFDEQGNMIYGK
jgi:hypothetical protein